MLCKKRGLHNKTTQKRMKIEEALEEGTIGDPRNHKGWPKIEKESKYGCENVVCQN